MVKEIICYSVACDGCGKDFMEDHEYKFWNDIEYAIDVAFEDGMQEIKDGHYCEDCCELDEYTDEYIIKLLKQQ